MKHPVRFLTVLAALGLLVAVFAASGTTAVQAEPGDDEVEWVSMGSGDDISFVKAGINAVFLIKDEALEVIQSGKATFTGLAEGTKYINLADGRAGADSTATSTAMRMFDAASIGYADWDGSEATESSHTGDGTATPLVNDVVNTRITDNFPLSIDDDGGITLLTGYSGSKDLVVTFQFHSRDAYVGYDRGVIPASGSDPERADDAIPDSKRAKVTSTSDPQGEWVTVKEVAADDDQGTASATSQLFAGMVALSDDAAASGTAGWCTADRVLFDTESGPCEGGSVGYADGGVWVQDGDTLTVTYYDEDLAVVDTDTVTVDTVKPAVTDITPAHGAFTRVANPTISFNVIDTGSGIDIQDLDKITLTINNVQAQGVSFLSVDDGVRAIFARPTSQWGRHNVTRGNLDPFPISITATDGAGNTTTVPSGDDKHEIDIDTDPPTVRTAEATSKTEVSVNFSEALDAGSVDSDGSDFAVAGATVTAASRQADDDDTAENEEMIVDLTVTDLEPDAKPLVSVVGSVTDKAGNKVDTDDDSKSQVTASDGIGGTITSLDIDRDLVVEEDEVAISLSFDEKLSTAGVVITVHGPRGGSLSAKRPTPLTASATFTVGDSDAHPTGAYGVSVQVTDLGNNTTSNLTKVEDEEPSIGDSDADASGNDMKLLTIDNGPIGDANFDGDIDGDDVTVEDISDTDNVEELEIASVNASARTITLRGGFDGDAEDLAVTYHYVPEGATFQVDHSAPTVTVDPANDATVKDQSPFIRIVFDEDEYPGDGYTSVTLDAATLTMPDGTDKDVTAMFQAGTADDIEFIWAASDLALGGYTLTVSATDSAGNILEDAATEFTVAKRTAEIDLRPGWNLISIPGSLAPDKRAINDVFTNGAVDIVLTYDARKRNWFRATRQSDGTLGQPGSSLELSTVSSRTAYWVHSTGVVTQAVDLLGASSQEPPVSIDLVAGWNLIPVRTTEVGSDPIDADVYLHGLEWTRAYGYNNTTQVFESILPDIWTNTGPTVEEGKGYWVYVREAGVLVP